MRVKFYISAVLSTLLCLISFTEAPPTLGMFENENAVITRHNYFIELFDLRIRCSWIKFALYQRQVFLENVYRNRLIWLNFWEMILRVVYKTDSVYVTSFLSTKKYQITSGKTVNRQDCYLMFVNWYQFEIVLSTTVIQYIYMLRYIKS